MNKKEKNRQALYVLGHGIYRARKQNNLTQKQVAQTCDLTTGQLDRLEKGQYNLGFYSLARILETLNVNMADLIDLKNR